MVDMINYIINLNDIHMIVFIKLKIHLYYSDN